MDQLYGKEVELSDLLQKPACEPLELCSPTAEFEMIEKCKICGKLL